MGINAELIRTLLNTVLSDMACYNVHVTDFLRLMAGERSDEGCPGSKYSQSVQCPRIWTYFFRQTRCGGAVTLQGHTYLSSCSVVSWHWRCPVPGPASNTDAPTARPGTAHHESFVGKQPVIRRPLFASWDHAAIGIIINFNFFVAARRRSQLVAWSDAAILLFVYLRLVLFLRSVFSIKRAMECAFHQQ